MHAWTLHSPLTPADSIEQSAKEAVSTAYTPAIDLTLATPQHQPGEHSLPTVTYLPLGQPARMQSQLEQTRKSRGNDLGSEVPEAQLKGPNAKCLGSSFSERQTPQSKGPKIKAPGETAPEKEASKKDSRKKIPERKRRPRCGQCIGCLQKDDCAECVACK